MSTRHGTRLMYRSGVVRLFHYQCGHTHAGLCGEECSDAASIVFPRRGIFRKRSAQGDFIADPNSVIFFNKGESYRVEHPVAGGDACAVFELHPDLLNDILVAHGFRAGGSGRLPDFPTGQIPAASRDFFLQQQVCRWAEAATPSDRLFVDEAVLNLCNHVIAAAAQGQAKRPKAPHRADTLRAHRKSVYRARTVLARRFREPLALADVARAAHCSPYHLSRLFHADTGMTLHRFRTRLRLRAALEELPNPQVDLTTLALDTGFSSHSHFTRSFQQEFGLSPSQARRSSLRTLREVGNNGHL